MKSTGGGVRSSEGLGIASFLNGDREGTGVVHVMQICPTLNEVSDCPIRLLFAEPVQQEDNLALID